MENRPQCIYRPENGPECAGNLRTFFAERTGQLEPESRVYDGIRTRDSATLSAVNKLASFSPISLGVGEGLGLSSSSGVGVGVGVYFDFGVFVGEVVGVFSGVGVGVGV
jgi:hypothetical protein